MMGCRPAIFRLHGPIHIQVFTIRSTATLEVIDAQLVGATHLRGSEAFFTSPQFCASRVAVDEQVQGNDAHQARFDT